MTKRIAILLLTGMLAVAAQASIIDGFNGDLSAYTSTVILDANGGGSNTAAWQISDGVLQLNTSTYDGIEQYALILNGFSLSVGEELQVDVVHNGASQDIGLYVGGVAPTTGVRKSYVNVYARSSTEVLSRGFTDIVGGEMNLKGGVISEPAYDKLFIARNAVHDFEAGYYNGSTRVVIADRNGLTDNDGSYIGIYADVRAAGVLGNLDNLAIIPDLVTGRNPIPQNGALSVPVDQVLSWDAPIDPNIVSTAGYRVYLDPNELLVSQGDVSALVSALQEGTSYVHPVNLEFDTTYYWRVDAKNLMDDPNHTDAFFDGPVWSFTTVQEAPIITQQPADARAFQTDADVALTCQFSSVAVPTVEWFKAGNVNPLPDGDSDIVINTANGSGNIYTSTLQILTPTLLDEGQYYCVISNPETSTTDSANLIINQLLAEYDFDGTLAPAAGSVADAPTGQAKTVEGLAEPNSVAASVITPLYVSGADGVGQAVFVNANDFIDFGTTGYPKAGNNDAGVGRGLDQGTVVFWIKPTTPAGAVLANFNNGTSTGFATYLIASDDTADARLYVRTNNGNGLVSQQGRPDRPGWDVADGQWHMIACTWEAGASGTIYVDGQPVVTGVVNAASPFADWQYSVLLGASHQSSNRLFLSDLYSGAVDNLRIYNYRLDADSSAVFAQEYLDATGIVPCLDANFAGNEFNYDNTGSSYCRVDLADFAAFASAWLEGGLYVAP